MQGEGIVILQIIWSGGWEGEGQIKSWEPLHLTEVSCLACRGDFVIRSKSKVISTGFLSKGKGTHENNVHFFWLTSY